MLFLTLLNLLVLHACSPSDSVDKFDFTDQDAYQARMKDRKKKFGTLMQEPEQQNIVYQDFDSVSQNQADIDVIQKMIIDRKLQFLLANEHIFGGKDGSIYIGTCGRSMRFCKTVDSLREQANTKFQSAMKDPMEKRLHSLYERAKHLSNSPSLQERKEALPMWRELKKNGYFEKNGCWINNCQRIIEINLEEDKKLQEVIRVFARKLRNIPRNHYDDPYWMLAMFVKRLFSSNRVELRDIKKMKKHQQDPVYMINFDDKKSSGKLATKIGDMVGSEHECAPMAIMFKVIADFFNMPTRLVTSSDHA